MHWHDGWLWSQFFGLLFWVMWAAIVWLVLTREALLPGTDLDDGQPRRRFIHPLPGEKGNTVKNSGKTLVIVLACLAAFGLGILALGHSNHLLRALPYLFLLACPLMHLLHRGHGEHSADQRRAPNREPEVAGKGDVV